MSNLTSRQWWADTLSRAGRQALQAAIPTLIVVAGGDVRGLSLADAGVVVAVAGAVTVVKALAGLTSGPGASLAVVATERAVAAAAGVFSGLVVTGWLDLATTNWGALAYSALGAAGLAVAQLFVDPPKPAGDFDLAA